MIASARNAYILKRLEESGIIDYKSISKELQVSEATVRRDFEKLEKSGKLRRVQGGAVRKEDLILGELSVTAKHNVHVEEKKRVAQAAAAEVKDGESIFLDCGTSIAPLAQLLVKRSVRIVTYNQLILRFVHQDTPAEVFLLGGRYYPADHMFVGPMTEKMLETFSFHRAFLGCMGWDLSRDSVYCTDAECLALKQVAMRNAGRKCLLTDASKENKCGLFRMAGCFDFDAVYTNGTEPERQYPENYIII